MKICDFKKNINSNVTIVDLIDKQFHTPEVKQYEKVTIDKLN